MRTAARPIPLTIFMLVLMTLSGCSSGPTLQERKAKREARQQAIAIAQDKLEAEVANRQANGEIMPERVVNPEFAVARCSSEQLTQDTAAIDTGFYSSSFVCENTQAGKKVVEWREWYCKGKERKHLCVLGRWDDGIPSYSGQLSANSNVGLPDGSVYRFTPASWRPPR